MTMTKAPTRTVERIRYPLRARELEVRSIDRIGREMVAVVFGSDDLADFRTDSPTDHVRIVLPDPDTGQLRLPRIVDDRPVLDGPRPVTRDYTVRRHDAERRELEIHFLAHGDGPAASWVLGAGPGDRLGMVGPRGSELVPTGYANYLLAGDRSAGPAIARWLDELPEAATAQVVLAVPQAEDISPLPAHDGHEVQWLVTGSVPEADALPQVISGIALRSADTWAWAAGEALAMREVRQVLIGKPGLSAQAVDVHGYWRRDRADYDHHAPLDADGPARSQRSREQTDQGATQQ